MSAPSSQPCPICKLPGQVVRTHDHGDQALVQCARCGSYSITGSAAAIASGATVSPLLSAWIRDRSEAKVPAPEINSQSLKSLVDALPRYSVAEKQLLLLRTLAGRSKYPGERIRLDPAIDYPLAWASGEQELTFHIRNLADRNLLRHSPSIGVVGVALTGESVEITADGWAFLDEKASSGRTGNQAFVAMSFSSSLLPAWKDGISVGLKRAGFRPYRTDAQPHIDRIDAKIITEIRGSRIVVADVTEQRPGVYFEAGFALGLGIPVFWSVRKDDLERVHFDTRQYNHIVWETEADLAEQLYFYVYSIVGPVTAA